MELESTVKRWDEVKVETKRLEALVNSYGCNPLPPHRVLAAHGRIWIIVRFRCFDPYKELLLKMTIEALRPA